MPPRKRNSQEKIISQFKAAHGERYDYSQVNYQTVHDKVTIICPDHGPFEQNPKNHRSGAVCPSCVTAKIKATCMARYGVDSHAKTEDARANNSEHMKRLSAEGVLKQGMIRKYGTPSVLQVPAIKAKIDATMMKNHGVSHPYLIDIQSRTDKMAQTNIRNGRWIDPVFLREFIRFKRAAWKLTEQNIIKFRAHWLQDLRSRKIQLDHIYSLHDAFRNGVAIEVVASICNLQLLPGPMNLSKGSDSWMTLDDLLLVIEASGSSESVTLAAQTNRPTNDEDCADTGVRCHDAFLSKG